jgi:hypothetical protein
MKLCVSSPSKRTRFVSKNGITESESRRCDSETKDVDQFYVTEQKQQDSSIHKVSPFLAVKPRTPMAKDRSKPPPPPTAPHPTQLQYHESQISGAESHLKLESSVKLI